MKYFFLSLFITSQLVTANSSFAASAVAGALEPTQILNNIELLGVNISDAMTAYSTNIDAIKNTVLDPIANNLISSALEQASGDIISWINGGFEGQPLIVSNPEEYIKNQGLKEVKKALGSIPADSAFGDSLFSSLAKKYMQDGADLSTTIEALTKDDMAGIIREKYCDDADLTSLAMEELGSSYTDEELNNRKNQLNDYICQGDINDPAVDARLSDLSQQRPELAGWDGWLCVTGGNCNKYTSQELIEGEIAKAQEEKEYFAELEIFEGAGPISQTECDSEGETAAVEGEDPECIGGSVTVNPGEAVQASLSQAANAGLQRLTNIMGDGSLSGILSSLTNALISKGLTKARTAISSATNSSVTTSSSRPIVQDLSQDSAKKESLLGPMFDQIDYYEKSLTSLESVDNKYLSEEVARYEARVQEGAKCYRDLVTDGLVSSADPRIAFYQNRQGRINDLKTSIVTELSKVAEAKTLISTTRTKLRASKSTQEISSIFDAYMSSVTTQNLPTVYAEAARKGEITRNNSDVTRDTEVGTYLTQCNQIRANANIQGF